MPEEGDAAAAATLANLATGDDSDFLLPNSTAGEINILMATDEEDATVPPVEGETKPEDKPAGEQPKGIELFGKNYEESDLQEIISKGENFTKVMQEVRETQRNQTALLEAGMTYRDTFEMFKTPEGAKQVIDYLVGIAKETHGEKWTGEPAASVAVADPEFPQVEVDDLSDEGQAVYKYALAVAQQNAALNARVKDIDKQLAGFSTKFEAANASTLIEQAVETIQKDFGQVLTPTQIRTFMTSTGLSDPIQAFKVANFEKAKQQEPAKGVEGRPPVKKPNSPSTQGRAVDTSTMTVDEIMAAAQRGEIQIQAP